MQEEIWKDIREDGKYRISTFGYVYSVHSSKILNYLYDKKGYVYANIYGKRLTVHRLVAKAFILNPENKPCINHKNGIKTDNSIGNLEWVTYQENNNHARSTGLHIQQKYRRGKENPLAKQVIQMDFNGNEIKRWGSTGEAERNGGFYNSTISRVCLGKQKTHRGFKWKYA